MNNFFSKSEKRIIITFLLFEKPATLSHQIVGGVIRKGLAFLLNKHKFKGLLIDGGQCSIDSMGRGPKLLRIIVISCSVPGGFHLKIIYTQNPFSLQILNKKVNSHIKCINIQLYLKLCTAN